MNRSNRCRHLAEAIDRLFSEGFQLSKNAMAFMASTFGAHCESEIAGVLSDADNAESATAMEFIFFPDESQQMQLEPLLEQAQFAETDLPELLDILWENRPVATLNGPGLSAFRQKLPRWIAEAFVRRLHLEKRLDPRLQTALAQFQGIGSPAGAMAADDVLRIKVRLRNAHRSFTRAQIDFLELFFQRFKDSRAVFFQGLDFSLAFLDETPDAPDFYEALMEKKRFLFLSCQRSRHFQRMLAKDNIETLMAQGVRAAYIDCGDAEAKIDLIDRIARALYGKSQYFDPLFGDEALGDFHGGPDLDDMVRLLS
jgi:hypothetical protein